MKKPKNYYCHRNIPDININNNISNKLQIIQKIGQGSFGQVYKVFDPNSSQLLVVKKIKKDQISQQGKIFLQLTNSQGFQKLKTYATVSKNTNKSQQNKQNKQNNGSNTFIMSCLGQSVGKIMKRIKKMNVYSMKRIAYQLINQLKQIHHLSYVHRDLKPDNILMGNKYDSHSVYLIDFGLTCTYKKNSNRARKIFNSIVGTVKYCPISSHMGLEQYPKDDLESLGYVLLFLVAGSTPWNQKEGEQDNKLFQKILKQKKQSTIQQLSLGLNCLRKYWIKIKSLSIGEKINYDELSYYFDVGSQSQSNCFEFCDNCWSRCQIKNKQNKNKQTNDQNQIITQPKSNKIRNFTLN